MLKQRLKTYFTAKPKQNFWFWAFITLFLARYVMGPGFLLIVYLSLGLVSPYVKPETFNEVFENASQTVADGLLIGFQKVFVLGQGIAQQNPLVGKILFVALNNFIWVVWMAIIVLILNLLRYFTSWVYWRHKSRKNRNERR